MKVLVIFRVDIVNLLFGYLVFVIGGGVFYCKLSFLFDSLGIKVFSDCVNIFECLYLLKGLVFLLFDLEGLKIIDCEII